jgi:hypothetical protein
VVPLGGVVVHHVQDHLDAGRVQPPHHLLELAHLPAAVAAAGVARVRREEVEGAVPPVVGEPLVDQVPVVHEVVDGKELQRRDADGLEVLDDGRVRHAGVGAAQLLRHVGMQGREPLDVRLVDDRAVPGVRGLRSPFQSNVSSTTMPRGMCGAVALVARHVLGGSPSG